MIVIKPRKNDFEYERVEIDEWVNGKIVEVQDRVNENRKYKDQETGEWKTKTVDEVRFVFELDGYKFKHYSRWMNQSVNKKATLYDKYLKKLVPGLKPDQAVDLSKLVGVEVKTMWDQETGKDGQVWQHVANIKPLNSVSDIAVELNEQELEQSNPEGMPF